MHEIVVRTLPRVRTTSRRRFEPPPSADHERRIARLQGKYEWLGLCGTRVDGCTGKARAVKVGGRCYPSTSAAERAIGATRGAVSNALRKGQRCHGLKVEWAD